MQILNRQVVQQLFVWNNTYKSGTNYFHSIGVMRYAHSGKNLLFLYGSAFWGDYNSVDEFYKGPSNF